MTHSRHSELSFVQEHMVHGPQLPTFIFLFFVFYIKNLINHPMPHQVLLPVLRVIILFYINCDLLYCFFIFFLLNDLLYCLTKSNHNFCMTKFVPSGYPIKLEWYDKVCEKRVTLCDKTIAMGSVKSRTGNYAYWEEVNTKMIKFRYSI